MLKTKITGLLVALGLLFGLIAAAAPAQAAEVRCDNRIAYFHKMAWVTSNGYGTHCFTPNNANGGYNDTWIPRAIGVYTYDYWFVSIFIEDETDPRHPRHLYLSCYGHNKYCVMPTAHSTIYGITLG